MIPKPSALPAATLRPQLQGSADGAVIPHVGRYARESVLLAFEMIGGVERLADWATKNPGEFYTKMFTKVVTREVEVSASEGIEDLLLRLDRAEKEHGSLLAAVVDEDDDEHVVDAEIVG